MRYKGKYNLQENLYEGSGFGLLTEAAGQRGRDYEKNVVAALQAKPNWAGTNLNSGVAWDVNLVKTGGGTGKTELKLDDKAAMGNIKNAGITDLSWNSKTKEWNVTFLADSESDVYIDPAMQAQIRATLASDKCQKTIAALHEYVIAKGGSPGETWVLRKKKKKTATPILKTINELDPVYQSTLAKHGLRGLQSLASFSVTGEDLRKQWLKKGRHYLILGVNNTAVSNADQIFQIGEEDPCGLGLGKCGYPAVVGVRFKMFKGSFTLQTSVSGAFSGGASLLATCV